MNNLVYKTTCGKDIEQIVSDLATLRIEVFKEFPYLYEGSADYEEKYLLRYCQSERAMVFSVHDADKMVGATTCLPLQDEMFEFKEPFIRKGYDLLEFFYFGESILLPQYRGVGLGNRFFDEREAHAKRFGTYNYTCFSSVIREENHPLRPKDYRPLDKFWQKRGYKKEPSLTSYLEWLDIGQVQPTAKPMMYWISSLHNT